MEKIKIPRKLSILVISFAVIMSVLIAIANIDNEEIIQPDYWEVSISDLDLCNSDSEKISQPELTIEEANELFVCGEIISEESLLLIIRWKNDSEELVVGGESRYFEPGFFVSYIHSEKLRQIDSPGKYKVIILYKHVEIGTIDFYVSDDS